MLSNSLLNSLFVSAYYFLTNFRTNNNIFVFTHAISNRKNATINTGINQTNNVGWAIIFDNAIFIFYKNIINQIQE